MSLGLYELKIQDIPFAYLAYGDELSVPVIKAGSPVISEGISPADPGIQECKGHLLRILVHKNCSINGIVIICAVQHISRIGNLCLLSGGKSRFTGASGADDQADQNSQHRKKHGACCP